MKRLLLKQVKGIKLGSVISLSVAHEYSEGSWKNYTEHKYRVEYFTRNQIVGRNIDDETESITIKRHDLDTRYFMLNSVQNPEVCDATAAK